MSHDDEADGMWGDLSTDGKSRDEQSFVEVGFFFVFILFLHQSMDGLFGVF